MIATIDSLSGRLLLRLPIPGRLHSIAFAEPANTMAGRPVGLGGWSLPVDHRLDIAAGVVLLGGRRRVSVRPQASGDRVVVDRVASRERLVFDDGGRLREILDHPGGLVRWRCHYDGERLVRVDDTRSPRLRIDHHHGAGGQGSLEVTDGERTMTAHLDADGYLAIIQWDDGRSWRLGYDEHGRPVSIVDGDGRRTEAHYDAEGLARLDEPGRRTDVVRTSDGATRRLALLKSTGEESSVEVAPLEGGGHRQVRRCCGSPAPITVERHPNGSQLVRQADGATVERRVVRVGGASPVWGDAAGIGSQRVEVVQRTPAGRVATSRRWVEEHPDGAVVEIREVGDRRWTRWTSPDGRRTVATSPMGRRSELLLDERGRAVKGVEPSGLTVINRYDDNGRLTAMTTGATTLHYGYRPDGTRTADNGRAELSITDSAVEGWTRTALPDGRLVLVEADRNRRVLTASVDDSPRWSTTATTDGGIAVQLPNERGELATAFTTGRDEAGRLARWDAGAGPVDVHRDQAGRLARLTGPSLDLALEHDPSGRVVAITTGTGEVTRIERDGPLVTALAGEGRATGRIEYDHDGFAVTATRIGPIALGRTTDADGLVTSEGPARFVRNQTTGLVDRIEVGRVVTTFRRDDHGRVVARTVTAAGQDQPVAHLADTFDDTNRAIASDEVIGERRRVLTRTYGPTGRLLAVEADREPWWAARWDTFGNRTVTYHLATDEPDLRLTVDARDRLTDCGDQRARYDAADQLAELTGPAGTTTFHHDALGRLVAVRMAEGTLVQHSVDGLGRRTATYVDGEYRQGYLWAGDRLAATLGPDGRLDAVFVPGPGRLPVAMIRDGRTFALVTDRLGSVRLVIDADSGQVVQACDYDPDGRTELDTNPGLQPFGFSGGLVDGVTDLVLLGARNYHPQLARWISRDPLLMASGRLNFHTYASGDPANRIDPSGLVDIPIPIDGAGTGSPIPDDPSICATDFGYFEHGMICVSGRCFGVGRGPGDSDVLIDTQFVEQTVAVGDDSLTCEEVPDVDKECLQDWIEQKAGTSTGTWPLDEAGIGYKPNVCWNPVFDAVRACSGGKTSGYESVPTGEINKLIYEALDRDKRLRELLFE